MNLFDVYPLLDITPVRAEGSWLWDERGLQYLDLYGGHAVISIGHSHPHYVKRIEAQLGQIGFYSNSVKNPLQLELAAKLGELSGYPDYQLFLCNSGAEANENALKLASFATGRKRLIAFSRSFHGRTSGAVAATDNPAIVSPFNAGHEVLFLPFNDADRFKASVTNEFAAVIIESIQGVGGIRMAEDTFLQMIREECSARGILLILDEIQAGYGRSGRFFAHQYAGIKPDLITTAKGMGNGFPIGGLLIRPDIQARHGMLGTTFGGNHLACAAAIAVLEVLKSENLIRNAETLGTYLLEQLKSIPGIVDIRGRGLMIGIDVPKEYADVRRRLLFEHHIFTGESRPNTIRLLPPLALKRSEADQFLKAFSVSMENPA